MRRLTILFYFVLVHSNNVLAQDWPKKFVEVQYKRQYYPVGTDLAQELSFIGMYKESLIESDRFFYYNKEFSLLPEDKIDALNAYPLIYKAIKENDIVILNENHSSPLHRLLFYNIIDSLKSLGVNSVFLETLGYVPVDSIYYRGDPDITWGVYSSENIYFQALEKLMALQLNLYSYEISLNDLDTATLNNKKYIISKKDKTWEPIEIDSLVETMFFKNDDIQREVEQALKIYQKIRKNKLKKLFIYSGGTHEWKADGYMAGTLKRLLKKDIYSIDQLMLNERSERKFESPLYQKYASDSLPMTLVNKDQMPIHTIYVPSKDTVNFLVDLVVLSPRTKYVNNRPTWLELEGLRQRYPLQNFMDVKKYQDDFLVIINNEEDEKKSIHEIVPADIFQVQLTSLPYDLILYPHKKYRLHAYKNGEQIMNKVIDVP